MSTKAQAERLIQSERELGQVQTIAIGPANGDGKFPLYDGHQRYSAWLTVKGAEYELTALQSNRPLTEDERRKMSILLHTATGGWDWNRISGWQVGELKEWGLVNQENVKGWNLDALNVSELLVTEMDEAEAFGKLPDGDRAPFRQMTFTLHDTQAEQVFDALKLAKAQGAFVDSPNENSNGNALARICETYITEHGNG
jgi:hypothetical protein